MQFQLSVYYINYYISYLISTEDKIAFHFKLKSVPNGSPYAPENFTVIHKDDTWQFDPDLKTDFKEGVIQILKKARL